MTTIPDAPSSHEETAQTIRLDLQRLSHGIRGFALLSAERRRKLNVRGHVEDDFLRSMALLVEAHPDIAAAAKITSSEIQDHLHFTGAFQGVGEELMRHGRQMSDTVLAERADIGGRALCALRVAREVNLLPSERAALIPHLEAIEREFTRGRRKRSAGKKPPGEAQTAKKEVKP
jgi:hypothetical protein